MLTLLGVKANSRKARLLACACARRLWDSLNDRCRRIVESMEGDVESGDLLIPGEYTEDSFVIALREAPDAIRGELLAMMECVFWYEKALAAEAPHDATHAAGRRAQAPLVRDIFNPSPPPVVDPSWLAWGGGLVTRLALAAYQERQLPSGLLDNDRLLVLADALEEAGCADPVLLGHLRSGGGHVRGCFVIDALAGRS
jgi:hypothetical protein